MRLKMEENKNEENIKNDVETVSEVNKTNNTEELKKETVDTVSQVKDTIKNVNIKQDGIETKGFIIEMFKNPVEKLQQIVNKDNGKYLTYAIIILAIWVISELVSRSFSFKHVWGLSNVSSAFISIVVSGITPIISILVLSLIVFIINKKNKKQLTTIITVIISASIPLVLASVVSLLKIANTKISLITIPFTELCNVISIVLMYFAIKAVFGIEKNSEFIKKFVVIETVYYIIYIILSLFNVNI